MSFKFKLFYIFTIVLVSLFLLSGILFYNQWKNFTIKRTVQNLRSFSELNSPIIVKTYMENITNKTFFLNREIYYIKKKQQDLKDILIVKTNGMVSYEFHSSQVVNDEKIHNFIVRNAVTFETSTKTIDKYFIVIAPYVDKWDRHFYSSVFVYDIQGIYRAVNRYIIYFILLEIMLIIVALTIGYFLSRFTTRKLEKLTTFALELENGDFATKIVIDGSDEFSEIAKIIDKLRINLKKYIDQLNLTIGKLKEANVSKEEFLENVSHELKTPLTSIIGYVNYLQSGELGTINAKQMDAILKIKRNTRKLNELISTLLLIQDKYRVRLEKVKLLDIIVEVCSIYREVIGKKGLKIDCNFGGSDYILLTDRKKLFSIFQHILENAIKFTKEGQVNIFVNDIEETRKVRVTIEDTGIGIPKDKLEKIFELFVQLDGGKKRRFGGVGIGLFTAKEFLNELSGTIKIESKVNKGTKVIIEIPYVKSIKREKMNISM